MRAVVALAAALCAATAAVGETGCRDLDHDNISYTVCRADPSVDDIRLWLRDGDGGILGTFDRVNEVLSTESKSLEIAMNAGMFHDDRRPVGHYVENGDEEMRVVTSAGPGNFGMLPNGVLCLSEGAAAIFESRDFSARQPDCNFATQSGPMLLIGGALHPRFLPDSTSRYVRNGVGVTEEGTLWMAISNEPVTFHEFARLFRDELGTTDALYLDGNVSRLYAPALGRHDVGFPMGPILGIAIPTD